MKNLTKISASVLLVAAAFVTTSANADSAASVRTVNFADLNLSSEQGVATLYRRIHAAARSVCPGDDTDRQLVRLAQRTSCMDEAEGRAVRQVNSSQLSAYYSAKTGRMVASLAANTVQ